MSDVCKEDWDHEFNRQDKFQIERRDRYLIPFYKIRYAFEGRYVFMEKFNENGKRSVIETQYDTVVQQRHGFEYIEEKISSWSDKIGKRDLFMLETDSCTNPGHKSLGWMHNTKPHKLLYAFEMKEGGLDIYVIDFQKLKDWFWPIHTKYDVWEQPGFNRTQCRKVPINDVVGIIPTTHYIINADLKIHQLPCMTRKAIKA